MGLTQPRTFFRSFSKWVMYCFFPGRTKRAAPSPVVPCEDVDAAARTFYRDGYVVVSNALTAEEIETIKGLVMRKTDEIVRMDNEGLLPPKSAFREANRYTFSDYGHCSEWEYLAHNEKILAVLKAIWRGRAFGATQAGGDVCLPGGTWQLLHSDLSWNEAGHSPPARISVGFYVNDVLAEGGPIRQVPGTAGFPLPSPQIHKCEPRWMRQSFTTGKAGSVVLRDLRTWHGGSPNESSTPRYMPNVEYRLRDDGGTNGQNWIAEFENS
jgi:ectoine hydroxylase-related dioxygenase (phytanoyl-CoA dioxygenase family)